MTSPLYLYDDALARRAEPFALSRPFGELRAGAALIRERWERWAGQVADGVITGGHLARFCEPGSPRAIAAGTTLPAGALLVNARFAPALDARCTAGDLWRHEDTTAAVRLATPVSGDAFANGELSLDALTRSNGASDVRGWWARRPWDLIRDLGTTLADDLEHLVTPTDLLPRGCERLGAFAVAIEDGARVEPFVIFDATQGAILVRQGATVSAFSRLVGPCVVGEHSQVLGGKVANTSIGPACRVHGEVSSSLFVGHANKGHEGFLGHSILGRWANLGAGTTTSNLKNTYGPVQGWAPDGLQETGMQFLGTLFGDHARTAIGTRLTTGAIVGMGANVLAAGLTPKVIAPFAFGDGTYRLDKFLEVASRVMARRGVALDDDMRACLTAAHAARWTA